WLDLDDAVARAGQIREAQPLRDDAVEARSLQRLQPFPPLPDVVGDRRQLEALPDLLELGASLLDRLLVELLPLPDQEVERDEGRGNLSRELADAALGRVEAHLHRIEVEPALAGDHDLAVERRVRRHELAHGS